MNIDIEQQDGVETIVLSRQPSPVAVAMLVAALLLAIQVGVVFLTRTVAVELGVLLAVVMGSVGWLVVIALEEVLPTKLILDQDGLKVSRLTGEQLYDWHDLRAVQLVTSAGMLSDAAGVDAKARLAIGLFLKSGKSQGAGPADADVLLYGASSAHLADLLKVIEHITAYKAAPAAGPVDRLRGFHRTTEVAARTSFRRPPTSAAT